VNESPSHDANRVRDVRPPRLRGLDGLRAASIVLVLFAHAAHAQNFTRDPLWRDIAAQGAVGVTVFFVLSGYLITWLLLEEERRQGRIDIRNFYIRRAFRILPPAYAFVVLSTAWSAWNGQPVEAAEISASLFFYRNLFGGSATFGHFWSLAIEEQFYLVWPFLVIVTPLRRRLPMIAAMIALAPFWRYANGLYFGHTEVNWLRTDLRFDGLLTGAALALARNETRGLIASGLTAMTRRAPITAMTATLVVAGAFVPSVRSLPGYGVVGPTLTHFAVAGLIHLLVAGRAGLIGRVAEQPLSEWLGRRSYSLYLWNQVFFFGVSGAWFERLPWSVVASIVFASLSYAMVELPALRLRDRLLAIPKAHAS
jgi:peptidoglycan/LPS O-acetylase OafA/YrhL